MTQPYAQRLYGGVPHVKTGYVAADRSLLLARPVQPCEVQALFAAACDAYVYVSEVPGRLTKPQASFGRYHSAENAADCVAVQSSEPKCNSSLPRSSSEYVRIIF